MVSSVKVGNGLGRHLKAGNRGTGRAPCMGEIYKVIDRNGSLEALKDGRAKRISVGSDRGLLSFGTFV